MKRHALLLALLITSSLLSACGGGSGGAASPSQPGTESAQDLVSAIYPANGSNKTRANTQLSVTFSDAMDPATINESTFKVTDAGGAPVSGKVSYSGVTAVFKPAAALASNGLYTATLTTGVRCADGTGLADDFSWTFGTSLDADNTPPTVTDTAFAITEQNGAYGGVVVAFFSEAMDPATINPHTFLVSGPGGIAVPGTLQLIGLTGVFTPDQPFAPLSTYTATVTTGAKDLSGIPLAQAKTWNFMTPRASILTGVSTTVASVAPADMSTGVLLGTEITVSFSQTMDPATITTGTFQLRTPDGNLVAGTVQYTGITAAFIPAVALQANTTYEATLTAGAASLAGIPMDSDYTWSFTTGSDVAGTPPVVQFTTPLSGDTNVELTTSVLAAFDEPMDPLSVTASTFTLTTADGLPVDGMVSFTGLTAVFTPSADLAPGTTYTARLTTGVKDAGGTPMANDYVWSFTTAYGNGGTPPQVLFTDPANGDANIATANLKITIAFSEVMDPRTINSTNISVTDPDGNPVPGTFTYIAYAMTFAPTNPLRGQAKYTVTIGTGVKDLDGTALPQAYSFYFVTAGVF